MSSARLFFHGIAAAVLLLLAACSLPVNQSSAPRPILASIPQPSPATRPFQTGLASWYGPGFHGRLTASGKIFDQHDHTAAHRTLPLGTRVRVTNIANGKSTEVTIIDRGPFAKDRIIDLSSVAAEELDMKGKGTVRVELEVIEDPKVEQIHSQLHYLLQSGPFG